jgi:hypothetical protein
MSGNISIVTRATTERTSQQSVHGIVQNMYVHQLPLDSFPVPSQCD